MYSKKKLTILAAALVCMLLVPVLASADDMVQIGDKIKFYDNLLGVTAQGPFGADVLPYNTSNPFAPDFYTFCVETNETFVPTKEYTVGGIGFAVVRGIATSTKSKSLQMGTAYLYSEFRMGNKGVSNVSPQSSLDAQNAMQAAIYYQQNLPVFSLNSAARALFDEYNIAASAASDPNYFGVRVMNIVDIAYNPETNPTAYYKQDMLTVVPLPGAFLLLGAGMVRLVAYARRRQEA